MGEFSGLHLAALGIQEGIAETADRTAGVIFEPHRGDWPPHRDVLPRVLEAFKSALPVFNRSEIVATSFVLLAPPSGPCMVGQREFRIRFRILMARLRLGFSCRIRHVLVISDQKADGYNLWKVLLPGVIFSDEHPFGGHSGGQAR